MLDPLCLNSYKPQHYNTTSKMQYCISVYKWKCETDYLLLSFSYWQCFGTYLWQSKKKKKMATYFSLTILLHVFTTFPLCLSQIGYTKSCIVNCIFVFDTRNICNTLIQVEILYKKVFCFETSLKWNLAQGSWQTWTTP
jgi:hypothetical protein